MKAKGKISSSIMCAEILDIRYYLDGFERNNIEYLHVDVMDGEFVPNYMLGTDYIKSLRKVSKIPLDIHLMIKKPEDKIDWFDFQKGECVAIHAESTMHLQRALQKIKQTGAKPMVAINPATPITALDYVLNDIAGVVVMTVNPGFAGQVLIPQTLQKITDLRKYLDRKGYYDIDIEVDGNVSFENAEKMAKAGADIYVAGTSSIFNKKLDLDEAIQRFRKIINSSSEVVYQ
ncbi:ribulose-phosphate 3-epimerase [Lachnotalea glycerini]|uniref:Ribulose-phosphate 3-epimerase n=1 Tax=Lachnotalea glycerini TaxID=1763509 RepID=A0A318EKR2_9FIRM|nr:ribulose-phosphate 3-epimerase [Lachnotalea glycerini]OYP41968.1 ribulose-phosphate 3-epimerase [Lachnotalea glycerini]PXV84751.1 ribulose-phosphate 3-epimerase [Lachnotalea glycerini]